MRSSMIATVARMGLVTLGLAIASTALNGAAVGQAGGGSDKPVPPQAPSASANDPEKMRQGRELFATWSCSSCHSLADAGATGHVGPSFDGNMYISEAFVKDRVTNGQGPMPAFGGQMTPEEIDTIAYYVAHAATKP